MPDIHCLLAAAESRQPWTPDDTKSGARFERVVIAGERYVLKYQDPRDDWLLRATGDPGERYVRLWESGLLGRLPAEVDAAVVAAGSTEPGGPERSGGPGGQGRPGVQGSPGGPGMILLRDVGAHLWDGSPFTPDQHRRFLDHMAALHATFWGWQDDVGLTPLPRRYQMFSPTVAASEARRGSNAIVPKVMSEGWPKLAELSPTMADAIFSLLQDPSPLVAALGRVPHTLVHGDWKAANLGTDATGRTILLDFGEAPGEASPLADLSWYLALNSDLLPETKDDTIGTYRAALERRGVDTEGWWDVAVDLELLGTMLQFGWEKALGSGQELAWWSAGAERGLARL